MKYSLSEPGVVLEAIGRRHLLTVPQNLYNNVTYMYPNANIWVIGEYSLYHACKPH